MLSTTAMFCRQEQNFVDKSYVVSTEEAVLEVVPAVFCRQEQGLADRSNVLSTGAALEAVPTAGATWGAYLGGLGACLAGLGPI